MMIGCYITTTIRSSSSCCSSMIGGDHTIIIFLEFIYSVALDAMSFFFSSGRSMTLLAECTETTDSR